MREGRGRREALDLDPNDVARPWRSNMHGACPHMQGLGAVFADELQIGFLHVGADEHDFGNYALAHLSSPGDPRPSHEELGTLMRIQDPETPGLCSAGDLNSGKLTEFFEREHQAARALLGDMRDRRVCKAQTCTQLSVNISNASEKKSEHGTKSSSSASSSRRAQN